MKIVLNEIQRAAVSWYFDPANYEGEPWPLDEPVEIDVRNGELYLGGCYLHPDGEWAMFSEEWPVNWILRAFSRVFKFLS